MNDTSGAVADAPPVGGKEAIVPRISRDTLKKRVGPIQALLGFAEKQRWIAVSPVRGLSVVLEAVSER